MGLNKLKSVFIGKCIQITLRTTTTSSVTHMMTDNRPDNESKSETKQNTDRKWKEFGSLVGPYSRRQKNKRFRIISVV